MCRNLGYSSQCSVKLLNVTEGVEKKKKAALWLYCFMPFNSMREKPRRPTERNTAGTETLLLESEYITTWRAGRGRPPYSNNNRWSHSSPFGWESSPFFCHSGKFFVILESSRSLLHLKRCWWSLAGKFRFCHLLNGLWPPPPPVWG